MKFKEWLFSSFPNPSISGQWGFRHIFTLVLSIAVIVAISLLFRKRSQKAKRIVMWVCLA